MNRILQLTLFVLSIYFLRVYGDLPSDIPKCKSYDNDECIAKALSKLMELYPEGYAEIGLPNVSALTVKEVVFAESNDDRPIQLNCKFNNATIYGLEKLKPLRMHGFDKNLTKPLEIEILVPELKIDGDYTLNGKLLLLSLNGKGKGYIIFKDATFKMKAKIELEERNGKNYAFIKKFKLWYLEPKKMLFNLENMVNNNAVLSESLNQIINENWSDLWNEFRNNARKATTEIVLNTVNHVLSQLSTDDFYLD